MVASEMVGVLKDLCIEIGVELASYSTTEIKKDATGKGNAGKPVMIAKAIGYKPEDDNAADAIHLYLLTKRLTTMKIKLLSDHFGKTNAIEERFFWYYTTGKSKKQRRKCYCGYWSKGKGVESRRYG
jgi:hypothetical protein